MSQQDSIESFQLIARERGGRCLSEQYINQRTRLRFECSKGHVWLATPSMVKGSRNTLGTWCKACGISTAAAKRMRSIEDLQALAERHGGVLVSRKSLGNSVKHDWKCAEGHPFSMIPNAVQQGQWCPKCRGNARPTFGQLNDLAREKSKHPLARCLSTTYKNCSTLLEWRCGVEEHPSFRYTYSGVKRDGSWCHLCKLEKPRATKYSREMLVRLATHCGGVLLSEEAYRNTKQKYRWRCPDGHEFKRSLEQILHARSFCPNCVKRGGMREEYIRELFFFMFDKPFERTRQLRWLENQNGNMMELDGYNPDLRMAFEHNGQQHYELIGHFMTQQSQLARRRTDDADKERLCRENDVLLIVVPFSIALKDIQSHILNELTKALIKPPNADDFPIGIVSSPRLNKLRTHADNLGGQLISDRYLGSGAKHCWQCQSPEHPPFLMSPNEALSMKHWCRRCANESWSESYKLSLEQLQILARSVGGEVVLDEVCAQDKFASRDKVMFSCSSCGRLSSRTIKQVKDGHLCLCRTKKIRIDRSVIEEKLLSTQLSIVGPDVIPSGKTLVTLRCKKCKREWETKASYLMDGNLKCNNCNPSRNAAITIQKCRELGDKIGYDLQVDDVPNGTAVLHWACKRRGHPVDRSYRAMRSIRRCLECAQAEAADRLGLVGLPE